MELALGGVTMCKPYTSRAFKAYLKNPLFVNFSCIKYTLFYSTMNTPFKWHPFVCKKCVKKGIKKSLLLNPRDTLTYL